jgi:tetratricopeptide (TPR) repeat protein
MERAPDATAAEVLVAAAGMEDAGALLLAQTVLGALARLAERHASALTRGRALAQRARVERQLGHFDVAEDLYADAGRIGARAGLADLQVRSDLGRGVLARIRGNYPDARRLFRRGLRRAERAGLRELTGIAHEGLMVAATAAGDYDTALKHGWSALAHAVGDPRKEADVLHNLADVCKRAGELEAALSGFLAAAARGTPRISVLAFANAAHAAALLGQRDVLDRCAARCDAADAADAMPYERAQRLLTLAVAYDVGGDAERAERYRHRGLELAWAHRFTELLMRYEVSDRPPAPRARAFAARAETPVLETEGRRVVRALTALRADAMATT